MGIKLSNNANATLAASITSSSTSITVTTGQGARFPTLSAGDYFYATLVDTSNNLEIVKCTARSTDVLTVVRAQESTTARAYTTGDRIEIRLTAQTFLDAALATLPATVSDQLNTSTGYFDLPSGTTAQRPATPSAGMIRHNTTTGYVEYWDTGSSSWLGIGEFKAEGGTVVTSGGYKYHTFTSSGTFTVTSGAKTVEYLIIAGGGSGGPGTAGGGGAGGLLSGTYTASVQAYSIVIGGGGAGTTSPSAVHTNGTNSTALGLTAIGGGKGAGTQNSNYSAYPAGSGGSGGGGAAYSSSNVANGSGTSGQGNAGGTAATTENSGGGGGGAGAVGGNASGGAGGAGGAGSSAFSTWASATSTGASGSYAGGGGGGDDSTGGAGGSGGGGYGVGQNNTGTANGQGSAQSGFTNTGGGGGGNWNYSSSTSGNGGSGIVIIRYQV
jgi:hypothetical protein